MTDGPIPSHPGRPAARALALRTALLVDDADAGADGNGPTTTAADAVIFDLTFGVVPRPAGQREGARESAARRIATVAAAGRDAHARVSPARSGEMEGDLRAVVRKALAAVVLSGAEIAQDVRDADVGIRRFEMQRQMPAGEVRLIAEIDSAAGVAALPALLAAVDRHSAVVLNVDGLSVDLGFDGDDILGGPAIDHAMWDVALAARAASNGGLPWIVASPPASAEQRARVAARAREFGAAGVFVATEPEVRGLNSLFTPEAALVEAARVTVAGWDRAFGHDRRALRRAQLLLAQAGAIERRERVR
ncbi:MAG: aldolase/citrate lyase family protein [Dehalococcoidia bacterium]|nr:aldolase/citrate lyase family protein [Dehalococcoidia bacterium]